MISKHIGSITAICPHIIVISLIILLSILIISPTSAEIPTDYEDGYADNLLHPIQSPTGPPSRTIFTNYSTLSSTYGGRISAPPPTAITQTAQPPTVLPGAPLTYTLSFTNHGPLPTTSIILTHTLANELTLTNIISSGSALTQTAPYPTLTWETPHLLVVEPAPLTSTATIDNVLPDNAPFNTTVPLTNSPPQAVDDAISTAEGTTATQLLSGETSLLYNDLDLNGDTLSLSTTPISNVVYGTLSLSAAGTFTYTHDGSENHSDHFIYQVCDPGPLCDTAHVTLTITPVNDPPQAHADSLNVKSRGTTTTLTSGATSVLANDSDPDLPPDILTATPLRAPSAGVLTLNANGTFTYTHDGSPPVTDTFTYQACDNGTPPYCATAPVNITLLPRDNAPPVATADTLHVYEGSLTTTLTTGASNVLTNDNDPDLPFEQLTVAVLIPPTQGTLHLHAAGTFTYTHNGSESPRDSFTYQICDSGVPALCDNATVTITVLPVNDAPLAITDTLTVAEGTFTTTLDSGATSVLDNDSDAETPTAALRVTLNTRPTVGTLALLADGTFTYTHNGSESPSDSFTYQICDSGVPALCDNATVTITVLPVNDAPLAITDTLTVAEGTFTTTLDSGAISVLDNDSDAETATAALRATLNTRPTVGTLALLANGTFTYTHNGSESPRDSFTYQICDSGVPALCDNATVTITVLPVNDAPLAITDTLTVAEGTFTTTLDSGATSVLDNDSDAETATAALRATLNTRPTVGTLALRADGTFTYTHAGSETLSDTFRYQICDNAVPSLCASANVSITVQPVNDPPTLTPMTDIVLYINSVSPPLPFQIADVDTPAATLQLTATSTQPALLPRTHLSFAGHSLTRTLTLTPTAAMTGSTTITVSVSDGEFTASTTFNLTVIPRPPLYLPLIFQQYRATPDLIVDSLTVTANTVSLVIKNQGDAPVVQPFWVDVYINPHIIPTRVNQTWDKVGDHGLVWGILWDGLPLNPGETLSLNVGGAYYVNAYSDVAWPIAAGSWVYAQADSAGKADYGGILETHEMYNRAYNNIVEVQFTSAAHNPAQPLPLTTGLPPRP